MSSARKLFPFLKPYWRWAALAPLLMLLEVMMDLMQPRMVQRIVDEGIARLDLTLVLQTGLLMLGLAIIGAAGGMSNGVFAEMTSQGFAADLREFLFRKVQTFSFANLDVLETGHLITRLTNDVTQVQEAIVMTLRMLVRAPLLLVGSLVMAIATSPQLAFLPLILMPIELVAVIWIVNKATPLFTTVQERLDGLNSVMQENLAGVRVVKAFVRASHEEARFGFANEQLTGQTVLAGRLVAFMPSFMMMTMNLGVVGVLWFGGIRVTQGSMQLGQIIAFVNYLSMTLFSLMMVSQLTIQLARAEASARRIQEVIDNQPAVQDRPGARQAEAMQGRVAFENVTFCYNDAAVGAGIIPAPEYASPGCEPVLRGVSFTAEPGQTVALLGMTGAGKSSLVHLIPRFYDVQSGRVTLDGVDVRDYSQESLRRQIGIALQEVVLFSGSIRDNICYGRPGASDEEVVAAAQAAQAHEFILSFPEGYATQIGQRGVNLSGGQKQRIAIARALLIQPKILILDDSTSAVDVETEARIQEALESGIYQASTTPQASTTLSHTDARSLSVVEEAGLSSKRTSIIIAQRISTVLNADKILVLDGGLIAAEGTHSELMENSPIYRDIYESQLGNGNADFSLTEHGGDE